MHLKGDVIHGRYEVTGQVGSGATGAVYRAQDRATSQAVALKQMQEEDRNPERERRFLLEAETLGKLAHPGIPAVVEAFSEDDGLYVAMQYVEGSSLDDLLRREGPMSSVQVLEYAAQICDVLHYLHSQSPPILHRDIKPQNVIVREDHTLVLVDFGLARSMSSMRNSAAVGTLGYAPLEQMQGRAERRSDLYSLGVTMYTLLCGHPPKVLDNTVSLEQALKGKVDTHVAFIVNMACQSHAANRYASADKMGSAIRRTLKGMGVAVEPPHQEAPPIEEEPPPPPAPAQAPARAGCMAAILLMLIGR